MTDTTASTGSRNKWVLIGAAALVVLLVAAAAYLLIPGQIGRASCRERVL